VPQIVVNIQRESVKPLRQNFIIGLTITKAFIPLCTFGYTEKQLAQSVQT
jgi:hypothetical protein